MFIVQGRFERGGNKGGRGGVGEGRLHGSTREEAGAALYSFLIFHIGAISFFRFFLRYFLRFAKNIANIYTNFCNPQNISQIFAIVIDLFCLFLR